MAIATHIAKQSDIWNSWVKVKHICGTFDLVMFKVGQWVSGYGRHRGKANHRVKRNEIREFESSSTIYQVRLT